MSTRTTRLAYLATTGVLLAETTAGSAWDLARVRIVRTVFERLEYPMYFATIIGVAKAAAVVAIVTPGLPRTEEWAYAGLTFVYGGAALSHLAVGDKPKDWIGPLGFAAFTLASWALRPEPGHRNPLALLRRAA